MSLAVLFKDPQLSVHVYAGPVGGSVTTASAVLKNAGQSILLSAAAADILVSYLRVIRAYFSLDGRQKQQIRWLYDQLVLQLAQKLQIAGQPVATAADITQLIQRLGCMHDWARQQQSPQLRHQAP